MRVLLLYPSFPEPYISLYKLLGGKAYVPPLGLLTVASLLPKDWEFTFVDLVSEEVSEKNWDENDVVMISGMGVQENQIIELIRVAKNKKKRVVVGGPWVFHFPEKAVENGADLVVRGEAEPVIELLVSKLRKGESGIIISSSRTAMEHVPPPRFDLVNMNNYLTMAVQYSRGCSFKCEFCDVTNMLGHKVRTKSPDQVIAELELLRDLGWKSRIFFVDDNLVGNVSKARKLLRRLADWQTIHSHPFEFGTQVSINLAWQDDLLRLMPEAGFWKVCIGIESTQSKILKGAKKLQNASSELDLACQKISASGLWIMATFIIGFDGESEGVDERIINFAVRNSIAEVQVFPLRASPGTELWKRMEKEERLLETRGENLGNQASLMNFASNRPIEQITKELINVNEVLCEPSGFLERASGQIGRIKHLPKNSSSHRPSIEEWWAIAKALWLQAVVYKSRRTFWRLLLKNSDHKSLRLFLRHSVIGACYFEFGKELVRQLRDGLSAMRSGFRLSDHHRR